jgi:hypothetical protein
MEEIGVSETQLLDIVRRKALSLPIPSNNESHFPKELEHLSLCALLDLIGLLRKNLQVKNRTESRGSKREALCTAAEALSNWPENFYRMLDDFGQWNSTLNPAGPESGKLQLIYRAAQRINASFILASIGYYFVCNSIAIMSGNYCEGGAYKLLYATAL